LKADHLQNGAHVTLKSIANNPEIDEIHERLHPRDSVLADLNKRPRNTAPLFAVTDGARKGPPSNSR